jgi:hypothetical protein
MGTVDLLECRRVSVLAPVYQLEVDRSHVS